MRIQITTSAQGKTEHIGTVQHDTFSIQAHACACFLHAHSPHIRLAQRQ